MAEFCFECFKKYFDSNAKKENLIFGKDVDLCEGCGKNKFTVIRYKKFNLRKNKKK